MSVKASNLGKAEGKDLRAIQLATYTAASVDGNTIVGYDLTTNTALASDITAWQPKWPEPPIRTLPSTAKTIRRGGEEPDRPAQRSMERKATQLLQQPRQTKPTSPSRMERRFPHSAKTKLPPCRPATYSYRESTPSWTVHRRQPH